MTLHRAFRRLAAVVTVLGALTASLSEAEASGDAILVLRNATLPDEKAVTFAESDLLAMPQVTVRTGNDFVDGVVEFRGPLARDVIRRIERGQATIAHMVAANDYAVDIPISDFERYDVILALFANGRRLSLRDKGPIWVIYPMDDNPELDDPLYNTRLIWQLTTIELR